MNHASWAVDLAGACAVLATIALVIWLRRAK